MDSTRLKCLVAHPFHSPTVKWVGYRESQPANSQERIQTGIQSS